MRFFRLKGIVAGLVLTFAGQTLGHDIDSADSCSGYTCSTPGQQCGPGVQGAYNDAYVCSEEKQWVRVPSTWEEDPSLFALLFHGHDHDEIEGLFNSIENESMYTQEEYDGATDGMFTQEEYDAATDGMFTQEYVNEEVAAATEGMVPEAGLEAAGADKVWHRKPNWYRATDDMGKDAACAAIAMCEGVSAGTEGWSFDGQATEIANAAGCSEAANGARYHTVYRSFFNSGRQAARNQGGLSNRQPVPRAGVADLIQYCDNYFVQ